MSSQLAKPHVLPPDYLMKFNSVPIYDSNPMVTKSDAKTFGNQAPKEREPSIIGINVGEHWDVLTNRSSIANHMEMDELTDLLQDAVDDPDDDNDSKNHKNHKNKKKRLCPPEIVFSKAFVSLSFRPKPPNKANPNADEEEEEEVVTTQALELRLDAKSALLEWATAHRYLLPNDDNNDNDNDKKQHYSGVSVLKTVDAKLWKERRDTPAVSVDTSSEFNFDWSYSTPYTGSIIHHHSSSSVKTPLLVKGWHRMESSGINMTLLTDRKIPILFYDCIHLYEDDLHDNGDTQLIVKLRVMPTCFYVLMRLYVRVDSVLLRCRETRFFHPLMSMGGQQQSHHKKVLYRDVMWREANWDQLEGLGLPTDVAEWTIDNHNNAEGLLQKLPEVDLPSHIPQHSCIDIDEVMVES